MVNHPNGKNNIEYNIEQFVFPLLQQIRNKLPAADRKFVDLLENTLQELISGDANHLLDEKWIRATCRNPPLDYRGVHKHHYVPVVATAPKPKSVG